MWLILAVLFGIGFMLAALKLSLMKGLWRFVAVLLTVGTPLIFVHMTVRLNMRDVEALFGNYSFITAVSTVVIAESLVILLFGMSLMDDHVGGRKARVWPKLVYLPSFTAVSGLVLCQALLFNLVSGRTYRSLALYESAVVLVMLVLGSWGALLLMRDWLKRLELTVVFAFLQLIIAMFVPIIAAGLEMPESNFEIHTGSIVLTFFTAVLAASAGYLLRMKPLKLKKGSIR